MFVNGTWITGFQSLEGIRNPQAVLRIQRPWIPDSISNIFPDAGLHKQKSPESWNPDTLTVGRLTEFQVLRFNYERTENLSRFDRIGFVNCWLDTR